MVNPKTINKLCNYLRLATVIHRKAFYQAFHVLVHIYYAEWFLLHLI